MTSVCPSLLGATVVTDVFCPSLLCYPCSNGLVVTGLFSVALEPIAIVLVVVTAPATRYGFDYKGL
jgi:hypothetical protein